ncbi:hypothetical protein [Virgibacillus halodenitrificans]|uniref:hypothetical protein n=1 Tax=Virgibacillus halodenitrificans TaxID=1482 RepID=UPI002DBD7D5F|nr:hypothetical protein [Virgibacillus halodenitrificans]MEC2158147.1 hypothetical protein [Virgibacillus halodenitrificans]
MYIASKWDYQGLSVESAAELYQSQVLFILRRAVLSAAEAFYPPESCFITRRSFLSAGEPIYPPQKPFIRRRTDLSAAEAFYPPENRFIRRRTDLSASETVYLSGDIYPLQNRLRSSERRYTTLELQLSYYYTKKGLGFTSWKRFSPALDV